VPAAWTSLAPPSPIREIEAQRKRVLDLRGQIDQRRQAADDARAAVVQAERSDREAMAAAMSLGKAATSNVAEIEKANAAAAAATRAFEAAQLAVANSEAELGAVVAKHRDAWTKRATGAVTAARNDAREALAAFRDALAKFRDAQQIAAWLDTGLDREQRVTLGLLGSCPGSQRWSANGEQVGIAIVLDQWLAEAVAEPAPQAQPREAAVVGE
jgi:hypothetical protein